MNGLPEMARFFLLSNGLQPGTSLVKHLISNNLDDLVSEPPLFGRRSGDAKRGYDLSVLVSAGGACVHAAVVAREMRRASPTPLLHI
jgi:hypothetical protein